MHPSFNFLPGRFRKIVRKLESWKISSRLVFIVTGLLATTWYLVRVIPKPSRAAYPCMQAAAPLMSGFILYLLSIGGVVASVRRSRYYYERSKYLLAVGLLIMAGFFLLTTVIPFPSVSLAKSKRAVMGYFPPNAPIGQAKGIIPGRVVWMWDPDATNAGCTNTSNENGVIDDGDNAWFMAKNNDPAVIDSMMIKSLLGLTGATSPAAAWDSLFRYFNRQHGNGNTGYSAGQKVFIKINATSSWGGLADGHFNADLGRTDHLAVNAFLSETDPYVVLSVLRQLVQEAGVPPAQIYVGDPARNVYKEFYDLWHGEFPGVHIFGNNLIHPEINVTGLGRTPVVVGDSDRVFFSDHGTVMPDAVSDKLFTIFDEMDYLINIPALKAHSTAGITLAAKNHFGSFTRVWALHLHKGLFDGYDDPVRLGYGLYRVQTDIMMHRLLSGKNLLIIVDGLYPGEDAGGVPFKWESPPFNGDWCSSIFMSLDPVAVESVCHDFLRTEYNGPTVAESRPNWSGVDDYLHQAADSALWPDGITYDPDNDQVLVASLGVHEHWNDSLHKQYTRNLGTGAGIELYKAHEALPNGSGTKAEAGFRVFPMPATDHLFVENPCPGSFTFRIIDTEGKTVATGSGSGEGCTRISITSLKGGSYLLFLKSNRGEQIVKIIKN